MIAGLERADHGTLLLGGYAAEHVVVLDGIDKCLRGQVLGQVTSIHQAGGRAVRRGQAGLRGERADRRRVVPRNDANVHALRTEVVESIGCVGAQVLLKDDEGSHRALRGQLIVHHGLVGVNEGDDARTIRRGDSHLGQDIGVLNERLVDHELRCAQNP